MKIALVGKMRSGKDTVGKFFIHNENCHRLAFGDEIKRLVEKYFPHLLLDGKPRKVYQQIGQYMRSIDNDVWINALNHNKLVWEQIYNTFDFVVTDVRQMNEYEYLKQEGFTVIKVEADDEIRKERIIKAGDNFDPEDFYHETEVAVDAIPYDYLITNNDTLESFLEQINFVYSDIKGEIKDGVSK